MVLENVNFPVLDWNQKANFIWPFPQLVNILDSITFRNMISGAQT